MYYVKKRKACGDREEEAIFVNLNSLPTPPLIA